MNLGKRRIEVVGLKWGKWGTKWGIFKLPHYIMSNHLNELCTVSGVSGVLWGDLIFTDSWIQNSARASAKKYPTYSTYPTSTNITICVCINLQQVGYLLF